MGIDGLIKCVKCGFMNPHSQQTCTFCRNSLVEPRPSVAEPSVDQDTPPEDSPRPGKLARPEMTTVEPNVEDDSVLIVAPGPVNPSDVRSRASQNKSTGRLLRSSLDEILFWLACDPLDPIPVGGTGEITVGRHQSNDLVLPHKEVSRFHATFKVLDGSVSLEDLGSSNGIYCNGKRHAKVTVVVGDDIKIGPYEILLRDSPRSAGEEGTDTRCDETLFAIDVGKAAFSGNLEETPLVEILQGLEFNQKSGTLHVKDRDLEGKVAIFQGIPHSATSGDLSGDSAVLALLKCVAGRFSFTNEIPDGSVLMKSTITGLLLDHSRFIDEREGS